MNNLELMKYRYSKTDTLKDKFLDAFRAITEYEHSMQPAKTHLDKLHYHLLTAVNKLDALLEKQRTEIDLVEEKDDAEAATQRWAAEGEMQAAESWDEAHQY